MAGASATVLKPQVEAPERAPTVVLFAETRGFTRLSEMLEPSLALAGVSDFFAMVGAAVERHDGSVLSVLNDTVLATFTGLDDALNAVHAAQDIQRDFAALQEAWQRDYGIASSVAMGLHRGEAVVGFPVRGISEQLLVFGDCVTVAERLLHRARAGEFVLSGEMMKELGEAQLELNVEELPPIEILRREPIRVFGALMDTGLDFT